MSINVWAHPLDLAFVEVEISPGKTKTILDLHPDMEKKFSSHSYFGSECELIKRELVSPQLVKISHSCAGDLPRLEFQFLQWAPKGYKVLGRVVNGTEEKAFSLDATGPSLHISDQSTFSFLQFLKMGT